MENALRSSGNITMETDLLPNGKGWNGSRDLRSIYSNEINIDQGQRISGLSRRSDLTPVSPWLGVAVPLSPSYPCPPKRQGITSQEDTDLYANIKL